MSFYFRVYPENWFQNLDFGHKSASLLDTHQILLQIVTETPGTSSNMLPYPWDTCWMLRWPFRLFVSRENDRLLLSAKWICGCISIPVPPSWDLRSKDTKNLKIHQKHEKYNFRLCFCVFLACPTVVYVRCGCKQRAWITLGYARNIQKQNIKFRFFIFLKINF